VGEYVVAFLLKLQLLQVGVFLFYTSSPLGFLLLISNVAFSFAQSGIALKSFENPSSFDEGFFVFNIIVFCIGKYTTILAPIVASYPVARIAGQFVFKK
jgi:hypothetical protein